MLDVGISVAIPIVMETMAAKKNATVKGETLTTATLERLESVFEPTYIVENDGTVILFRNTNF